jgi:hypothetical protein
MQNETKSILISVLVGAGAGALVGFGVWWYASRQLEQGLVTGTQQLASQLGMGTAELQHRLDAGAQQLHDELAQQVAAQVPPAVRTQIESTFRNYGITPQTGARIDRLLSLAERLGAI